MSSDTDIDTDMSASLALLTPEERAAIAGDDGDPADTKTLESVIRASGQTDVAAHDDGAEDDESDDSDDSDGAEEKVAEQDAAPPAEANEAPAADPQAPSVPAAEAAPVAEAVDDLVPAVAPVYVPALPEDFATQVDGVKTALTELRAKFKDGEIALEEYEDAKEKLEDQRRQLDQVKMRHDIARDQADQAERSAWAAGVNNLFKAASKDGVDYAADEGKRADLDLMLKTLAARQENADKPMAWFLREAHRRVMVLHDIAPAATSKPAAQEKPASKPAAPRRTPPPISAAQPSLAQVPGGDGPGDDGSSEYQNIDELEGEALEEALARMSPRDRDRYLRMH